MNIQKTKARKTLTALTMVTAGLMTMPLLTACSPGTTDDDGSGGAGGVGGAGGDGDDQPSRGGSRGTGSKNGGTGGSDSGGTGGSDSGGTGGSDSGGTGGSASGGAGGMMAGGMGGTNEDPGPFVEPFPVTIEPGTFTEMLGVNIFGGGNTCCIGGVDGGDWVKYAAVDFGAHCAYDTFKVRYASPNDGGILEVHIDSLTGPIISTVMLTKTGEGFETAGDAMAAVEPVSGEHEIFVRFSGINFGIGNFTGFSLTHEGTRMACP